jgi:hypothetical protein
MNYLYDEIRDRNPGLLLVVFGVWHLSLFPVVSGGRLIFKMRDHLANPHHPRSISFK